MPQKTIIDNLPSEMMLQIFRYFDHLHLTSIARVCRRWREFADDDSVWRPLSLKLWTGKQHTTMELAHRMQYGSLANSLTMQEIRCILRKRNVQTKGLLEKSEWINSVKNTTPAKSYVAVAETKWKASYIAKLMDSKKKTISKDELCAIVWSFQFIRPFQDNLEPLTVKFALLNSRFHPDYKYESTMFERRLNWRFYDGEIQIEQYPCLSISRTSDWGWLLVNDHVVFSSGPMPDMTLYL